MNDARGDLPMRCVVKDGVLSITIGIGTLAYVAAQHPEFWDGKSGLDVPCIKVTDEEVFANEVANELNRESEDGSTRVTRLIDAAISEAVDQGAEGIDNDALDAAMTNRYA